MSDGMYRDSMVFDEGDTEWPSVTVNEAASVDYIKVNDEFQNNLVSVELIAFLILMQNGKGIIDKSPEYIREKMSLLKRGAAAAQALDHNNLQLLQEWYNKWSNWMPKGIEEQMRQAKILTAIDQME